VRMIVFVMTQTTRRRMAALLFLMILLISVYVMRGMRQQAETVVRDGLPLSGTTVVIDPGHGGYDPGVWQNDLAEKQVVLAISLVLRDYLQAAGARVVMTRETDRDLLVLPAAGPKKQQDMENRLSLIKGAQADILISVHANAISSSRWHGAQVFYNGGCEASKVLAEKIQQEFIRVLANTDRQSKTGNYFLLNQVNHPAVLVEVGFISNPQEAALLSKPAYQSKVAWSIYLGIIAYMDAEK
jgi:N-acetylmuramoyl-L-alanine amidase